MKAYLTDAERRAHRQAQQRFQNARRSAIVPYLYWTLNDTTKPSEAPGYRVPQSVEHAIASACVRAWNDRIWRDD